MADKKLHLRIVSPSRLIYENDVDMVILRAVSGDMGILPDHENTTTLLSLGVLRVKNDGVEESIAILGGFCTITKEGVNILSDAAETYEDIDKDRALSSKERAEKRIKDNSKDVDVKRAEASLRRALVRLEVYDSKKK